MYSPATESCVATCNLFLLHALLKWKLERLQRRYRRYAYIGCNLLISQLKNAIGLSFTYCAVNSSPTKLCFCALTVKRILVCQTLPDDSKMTSTLILIAFKHKSTNCPKSMRQWHAKSGYVARLEGVGKGKRWVGKYLANTIPINVSISNGNLSPE